MTERAKRRVLLVIAVALLAVIAVGGPLWTARNETPAATGRVVGTITSQSGIPLPEISVQVYRWQSRQWEAINAVDTNSRGRYRFVGLPSGRYTVAFEDDSGAGYLESWWGGGLTAASAKYREVGPGATVTMSDEVVLGAAITGHAIFVDPERGAMPATQFSIVAYPLIPAKSGSGYSGMQTTRSVSSLEPTADGGWRIQNLRSGSYVLQAVDNDEDPGPTGALGSRWVGVPASRPYSLAGWRSAEVFTVVNGRVYSAPSVTLTLAAAHPKPSLTLRVTGGAGAPIAGAKIDMTLTDSEDFVFASGAHGAPFTDTAGNVGIYRPIEGIYALTISAPGYKTLTTTYRFKPGPRGTGSSVFVLRPKG